MALFDALPGFDVEVQDGGLRISRPVTGPKVTVLGVTDKTDVALNTPTLLQRREDIVQFDLADGSPSELSRVLNEVFVGGADNVEAVIISNDTGLSADDRYVALGTSYDLLFNTELDVVVPAGAYIDTALTGSQRNFGYQLADLCYQATRNNNTVIGVIGVEAPTASAATTGTPSLAEMEAHVAALETYDTSGLLGSDFTIYDGTTDLDADDIPENYGFTASSTRLPETPPTNGLVTKDGRGNFVDIGAYLSVVATWGRLGGDVARRLNPQLGFYQANGAGVYAGRIATLDSFSAPTNKPLPGFVPLREISLSQANRLARRRFVSIISKPLGIVPADAMTGAYNISQFARSDFVRLTTVRIVHDAVNLVRRVAEPFIGEPNNAQNRNAIEVAVNEAVGRLQQLGALEGYSISLVSTPQQRIIGEISIDMRLTPAFEIRTIRVVVGLQPAQG